MSIDHQSRVIFALDPLEPELIPSQASLLWLKKWMKDQKAEVEAVYVTSAETETEDLSVTQGEFADFVSELNLGDEVKAIVLKAESSARKKTVETLVTYAKSRAADFIVVSSHGRTGIDRWMMGSFAERLLGASPVPLLFLSPFQAGPAQVQRILFPTDFSEASKAALDLFLSEISEYKGELILYNADSPPGAVADTGILGIPFFVPQDYWLERRRHLELEAARLKKEVTGRGFKVRTVIQDGVVDTPLAIRTFAEQEKVDLIAMVSMSKGFDLVMAGSIAREMVRMRQWPLWISGPQVQSRSKIDLPRRYS